MVFTLAAVGVGARVIGGELSSQMSKNGKGKSGLDQEVEALNKSDQRERDELDVEDAAERIIIDAGDKKSS